VRSRLRATAGRIPRHRAAGRLSEGDDTVICGDRKAIVMADAGDQVRRCGT
jgi:hypothetical protein